METLRKGNGYNRILVSRYNPKNGCYVDDGEYLVVWPKVDIAEKDYVTHHFSGLINETKTSKYGWVKVVPPFNFNDFISKFIRRQLNDYEKTHLIGMFESIANLKEGDPVAATYRKKSFNENIMELKIHKIIFYKK